MAVPIAARHAVRFELRGAVVAHDAGTRLSVLIENFEIRPPHAATVSAPSLATW